MPDDDEHERTVSDVMVEMVVVAMEHVLALADALGAPVLTTELA